MLLQPRGEARPDAPVFRSAKGGTGWPIGSSSRGNGSPRNRQVAAVQPLGARSLGVRIHQVDAAMAGRLQPAAARG